MVSHTRKGGGDDIEDVSGSAQRGGAADVILMVNAQKEGGRVLSSRVTFAKLRDSVGEHPEPVTFSIGRDEGKWWVRLGECAESAETEPPHERVHALLKESGEMTAHQLRKLLGMSHPTMREALNVLRAEKRTSQRETLIGGQKRVVYRVRLEFHEMGLGQPK